MKSSFHSAFVLLKEAIFPAFVSAEFAAFGRVGHPPPQSGPPPSISLRDVEGGLFEIQSPASVYSNKIKNCNILLAAHLISC
jgi:hypothetical protein